MGLIIDLIGARVACMGLGNAYTLPLGYVIVWVQVDGVQGYDEDQIALEVPDESKFAEWIPVILGTPTISHIINIMKEREINALAMPWVNARVAHLLSVCRAMATVVDDETAENANSNGYDEVVFTINLETIDTFSSHVLPIKVEKAYTGEHINVMTHALQTKDGSLPQGLTIQNMYTELWKGSKNVVMVVRNSTAYPKYSERRLQWPGQLPQLWCWKHHQRPGSEGEDGPQDPHPPIWPLDKGKVSCLKN